MLAVFKLKGFSQRDIEYLQFPGVSIFIKLSLLVSFVTIIDCSYLIYHKCGLRYSLSLLGCLLFLFMTLGLTFSESNSQSRVSTATVRVPPTKNANSIASNKRKCFLATSIIIMMIAIFHVFQLKANSLCNTFWCYGYFKDSQSMLSYVKSKFPVVCEDFKDNSEIESALVVEYNVVNQKQIERINNIPGGLHKLIGGVYLVDTMIWGIALSGYLIWSTLAASKGPQMSSYQEV